MIPTEDQKRRVRMLQATFYATKAREMSDNQSRPQHQLQSRSYRKWAEKEYQVVMREGWPIYAKTGELVLNEDTKKEYRL
jgi:hypothetical protein